MITGVTQFNKKVQSLHIEWNNNLREKRTEPWQPIEVESAGKTVSFYIVLDDGTRIEGRNLQGEVEYHEPR